MSVRIVFNADYGMMAVPACPHEGCGWFMPQLWCPAHGNFGMTFLAVRRGPLTWVKAVLGIPRDSGPSAAEMAAVRAGIGLDW